MKTFMWVAGLVSMAFITRADCITENKTEEKSQYLENIYFTLSGSTSQHNVKKLAEFILNNHGINAEINVSL